MNVFNLTQEHYDLMSVIEELEGEMTPELQQKYDNLMIAGEQKLKALYWVYKHMNAQQTIIEAEEKRIQALKKSNASRMEYIKKTMDYFMKALDLKDLKDGTINIIMAKHTEFLYDETKVPKGYYEIIETEKFKLAEFKAWCKDNQEAAEKLCGAKFVEGKKIQIK